MKYLISMWRMWRDKILMWTWAGNGSSIIKIIPVLLFRILSSQCFIQSYKRFRSAAARKLVFKVQLNWVCFLTKYRTFSQLGVFFYFFLQSKLFLLALLFNIFLETILKLNCLTCFQYFKLRTGYWDKVKFKFRRVKNILGLAYRSIIHYRKKINKSIDLCRMNIIKELSYKLFQVILWFLNLGHPWWLRKKSLIILYIF